MFSKNNKISKRQMFRLLTYDLLGIGTLLLPSALAKWSGKDGMLSILIGIAAGIVYCLLIGWLTGLMEDGETYPAWLKRSFGKVLGSFAVLYYACYYLCLGGYATYIFGHLIVSELLKEQSFYWIAVGIVALCAYNIFQGMEGRARVYEILFWFLMAPLFLMLFFAARDVELPRLFPLYGSDSQGIWIGSYFSFEVFSLGGMALFLVPFAKKKTSIRGACIASVLFAGLVLLALYGILQGIFGVASMKMMEYPAVTLMSMIQIPGGFLQRQDALMVAVWFFTVFALLSSSMFYAAENLKALFKWKNFSASAVPCGKDKEIPSGDTSMPCGKTKERLWILFTAGVLFGVAVVSYRSRAFTEGLHRAFLFAATPLVVLIPLLAGLCVKFRGKGRKIAACAVLLCEAALFSGCSTTELENRKFPLAMGIDETEDGCMITYKFQDLSKIADQNADSPSGTDFYIEDKDFFTGISKYANDTNKILDYNHMKVLILSKDFVEDTEALANFLRICGKESLIARNTLLFVAEDAAAILALDSNLDTAIGNYLEEMIDSREDYKLKDAVTLGDLHNEMENQEQLLLVPMLADSGGLPVIRNYYAIYAGVPKGELDQNEAALSYLCQGKLKKLAVSLDDGTAITINRIRAKGDFPDGDGLLYRDRIRLEVVVEKEMDTDSSEGKKIRQKILEQFQGQLNEIAENRLKTSGIDITNSFYKLGMCGGENYAYYGGDLERFLKDLGWEFEIEVVLLNERG